MKSPLVPPNEEERLAALQRLALLDTPPEDRFDRITRLAMALLEAPISLFTLVDEDRQWFKSHRGIDEVETPREISFCAHAILGEDTLVVPDTTEDVRFQGNPQVTGGPLYRSYAGHPVRAPGGETIGTLCVLDRRPREFDDSQLAGLADLAALLEDELRLVGVGEVYEELEAAAAARREAQDRALLLEKAVAAAPVGIVITDPRLPDNPIVSVNPEFQRLTGYSAEEIIGRNCRFLQGEDTDPETVAAIRRAVEERRPFLGEILNYRRDGTPFWNQLTIAPVPDEQGDVVNFIGAQSDVTARKRGKDELEALVQERIADLRRSEEALRESREQLLQSQKMEAVGRLAGGVAHDFNNMLSAILGFSELALQQVPEDHPVHHDIEEVRDAGQRAAALTRQLLAFSRKQVLAPRLISLNEAIRRMESMLVRVLRESIALRLELAPDLPAVEMDPSQLEQVVLNLAVNASDAMPDGGELVIRTRSEHDVVQLVVADSGVGMDAETANRVFEPFFTTKEPGKGTGLGLSTVYGIVEQSGGHVTVESSLGEGARFTIELPAVEEREHDPLVEPATDERTTAVRATVLLVEDEAVVRRLVRRCLEEAGCEVVDAAHGKAALETWRDRRERFDLVITDLVMPELGGRDLAARLRSRCPDLPVLFMTGYADEPAFTETELDERSALVQKPIEPAALLRRVRELLS